VRGAGSLPLPSRGRETAKRSGGVTRARQFRNNMTDAEWKMWFILRDMNWPGAHFRRQARIGPYYADFLSHAFKTIIEVDGSQHGEVTGSSHDTIRDAFLRKEGFSILRFWNLDVLKNPSGIHDAVAAHLSSLTPTPRLRRVPSPQGGGSNGGNST
jgi:very-short-patch-repair endonuclease